MISATDFTAAATAACSWSVRSTIMAGDLWANRHHKSWQAIEQNQTAGRGRAACAGSAQPKPRAGRRQTAQSAPSGCQRRRRSEAVDMKHFHHAAFPIVAVSASNTSAWMAALLKRKVNRAE